MNMNECTNAPFRSRCRDCWERQERQGDEHGVMIIESFGAEGTHMLLNLKRSSARKGRMMLICEKGCCWDRDTGQERA